MVDQQRIWPGLFICVFVSLIQIPARAKIEGEFKAGEFVIQLNQTTRNFSSQKISNFLRQWDLELQEFVSKENGTLLVQSSLLVQPDQLIAELSENPWVDIAEPNYIYKLLSLPNDSLLGQLWGLENKDKDSGGVDIEASKAWTLTTGSRDVVVAVIDTGVNHQHPDLIKNMWVNEQELHGQVGVDDDGNGYVDDIHGYDFANNDGDPMDDLGHGTHCAGTIGAEGNNGIGVVGVNWQVSIMAIKLFRKSRETVLSNVMKSIDYATQMQVDVMSNSWGGGVKSENMRQTILRAEKAGILFVAAAGNEGRNNDFYPSYPANFDIPNVISVAAVNSRGQLPSFSNYGRRTVDIGAPGVQILSTSYEGRYEYKDGTSMATPHVAGAAALLLAQKPNLTYVEVKERLLSTSVPLSGLKPFLSHGFLNIYNVLTEQ